MTQKENKIQIDEDTIKNIIKDAVDKIFIEYINEQDDELEDEHDEEINKKPTYEMYFNYWDCKDNNKAEIGLMIFADNVMVWSSNKIILIEEETKILRLYNTLLLCLSVVHGFNINDIIIKHENEEFIKQLSGEIAIDSGTIEHYNMVNFYSDKMKIKYVHIKENEPTFIERAIQGGKYIGRLDLPAIETGNKRNNYILFSGITWERHSSDVLT